MLPFALIYGGLILLRNFFYDKGWLRSFEFDFPIILVGNISSGGTGKTPHVEYLIRLLRQNFKVATLSRGYKRQMPGYGLATELSLVEDIGDESKLYKQKYTDVEVAVNENRVQGVYYLLNDEPDVRVILMDDGFQHRRIKPGLNIILTAYHDLYIDDNLLPAGNLREPAVGIKRAHIIIVTKCPSEMNEIDRGKIINKIKLKKSQNLFFSTLKYGNLYPLFPEQAIINLVGNHEVLLVTGIAENKTLHKYLQPLFPDIVKMSFRDHHYFTEKDLINMSKLLKSDTIIITTEKDAMRLMEKKEIILDQKLSIFVLPVEVQLLHDDERFSALVFDYINQYEITK